MTRRLTPSTAYTVVFKVFLASDHVTPATGKTVAITLSKAGAAFGNPAAGASSATEISGGWYKFALGTGDTNTIGDLVLVGTAALCDTADIVMTVGLMDANIEAVNAIPITGSGTGGSPWGP
jgi:hypothetical protein